LFNQFSEIQEFGVEALSGLSFGLFLFQFVHIVELSSAACEVDVFSCYSRLLRELHVLHFLVRQDDWRDQVEMEKHDQLI
jgi:hypothetical protein